MSSAKLFIGIESVGRRAMIAVASTSDGTIVGASEQFGGLSFYTTPTDEFVPKIRLLIGNLQDAVPETHWAADTNLQIVMGMSGINTPFDAQLADYALRQIDQLSNANLLLFGDIEISFVGSAQAVDGSAVFAAAGSVVAAFVNGSVRRFGGWGPAFTDDGSSYQMGRDALRLIAEWSDHKQTSQGTFRYSDSSMAYLWDLIEQWMRYPGSFCEFPNEKQVSGWADIAAEWRRVRRSFLISNPIEDLPVALVAFTYGVLRESLPAWWNFVASLSIPLIKEWDCRENHEAENNPIKDIIEQFIIDLSIRHRKVLNLDRDKLLDTPCVFCGGLFNHNYRLASRLFEYISRDSGISRSNFTHLNNGNTHRAAIGALLLSLGESTQYQLRIPSLDVLNHINCQLDSGKLKWSEILKNA